VTALYKSYTIANNSVINWRKSIDAFYKGGLPTFPDATTIRHMLNFCDDYLARDTEMTLGVEDEQARQEFADVFAEERACMTEIRAELEGWLKQRNLPR
jgi:uncharacterized protein YbgA (DUF1722 family)